MVTEHWAGSWSLPSSSSPALVSLSPPLSTNCPSRDKAQVAREQGYLCMAADRALDAVGVRGASGGRGYCWPPAAPPHQQVPTWGRPIHEVGAVGRSGGEAGGAYRRLHAREGGGHHVPLSPAFIPEFLLVRWRESWLHQQRSSLSGAKHADWGRLSTSHVPT